MLGIKVNKEGLMVWLGDKVPECRTVGEVVRGGVDLSEEAEVAVREPELRDGGDLYDEVRRRVELVPRAQRVEQRVGELGARGGHADGGGGQHEGEAGQNLEQGD